MKLHIRSGQQSDLIACIDILCKWAEETPWMVALDERQSLQAFWSEIFEIEQVWIAEIEDRIVGFCTRDEDNIGALYVSAEARSKGIGKRLLDRAKADRDWITVWAYEENKQALCFYKREGLVEMSREIEEGSNLMNIEHRWNRPD